MKLKYLIIAFMFMLPFVGNAGNTWQQPEEEVSVDYKDIPVKKGGYYEGDVSVEAGPFYMSFNTSHGKRLEGSDFVLGGTFGVYSMLTWTDLISAFVGFHPKWYFAENSKIDGYLSCDTGYMLTYSYRMLFSPHSEISDFSHGISLNPEIGMGVKLKDRVSLEFAFKISMCYNVSERMTFEPLFYFSGVVPGLSIGIRF